VESEVIILFQEIPEDLRIYKFTLDEVDLETLKGCHDLIIGEDMPENLGEWLLGLISDRTPIYSMGHENAGWPVILDQFSGHIIVTGITL